MESVSGDELTGKPVEGRVQYFVTSGLNTFNVQDIHTLLIPELILIKR